MFNGQKKRCSRTVVIYTKDEYNQDIPVYLPQADINIFIADNTDTTLVQNDMRLQQATYIGLTTDGITEGDIIADKYEVTVVKDMGKEFIAFMRDRANANNN